MASGHGPLLNAGVQALDIQRIARLIARLYAVAGVVEELQHRTPIAQLAG